MGGYLLIAGIVAAALTLAVYWHGRSRNAETQAYQNNTLLNDFMATEMAMKAGQLESYKAMLRNPNPRPPDPRPSNSRFEWEEAPHRRF